MKINNYSIEELEQMTYSEITEIILTEKGSKMKIVDIFRKICDLLSLGDSVFENKVADFFELVSTDSRFIVLDKGYCDLRKKHAPKIVVDDEEEDIEVTDSDVTLDDEQNVESEETDEDIFYDSSSDVDDIDDGEDDLDDFAIIEEDEEETNGLV